MLGHRDGCVLTRPSDLRKYNLDWTTRYEGRSRVVVRPRTTEEVAAVLAHCDRERIGVVPQGGNTGLVGGGVAVEDEVVLSTERLAGAIADDDLDEVSGVLSCDAGCVLEDVREFLAARGRDVPIDVGSAGSCAIGGNVSTHAGGQYRHRRGPLRGSVLGLRVVLASGAVMDLGGENRKDVTGLDLKQCFVGTEGTLGVVTRVTLDCPTAPRSRQAAFLLADDFGSVLGTLASAKEELGETLAAFELMDRAVLDLMDEPMRRRLNVRMPVSMSSTDADFALLVETQGSNEEHDAAKMRSFLQTCFEKGLVADGVLAQDATQVAAFWKVRESCAETLKSTGYTYKYDVSVPIVEFHDFVAEMRSHIASRYPSSSAVTTTSWGHLADGNVHLNVTVPGRFEEDPVLTSVVEPTVFEAVVRRNGSISAEHGVGRCKRRHMTLIKDENELRLMRAVKALLDPNGILNPGKLLP